SPDQKIIKGGCPKQRLQIHERKPSPQSVVHHGERPVSCVHHSQYVDIWRDIELFFIGTGIGQGEGVLTTTFIGFNQHEQFTEDLAEVAPVDLVNDKHIVCILIQRGPFAEAHEHSILPLKADRARAISLNEVLVRVALMKLDETHS